MDLERLLRGPIGRLPPRVADAALAGLRKLPPVRRRIEAEYETLLADVRDRVKPYRDEPTHTRIPAHGIDRGAVVAGMEGLLEQESAAWRDGRVSGAVYHGDREHLAFLDRVLAITSQVNPLHADLWPSVAKYEAEIVAMTAAMLGAGETGDEVVGTVTSGGTESILLAVKAYRDRARAVDRITRPEMVVPETAHAAFDKAGECFGVRVRRVAVDAGYRADPAAMAEAVGRTTILVAASAPTFPHGVIDPVADVAALAAERGIGCHVDACLGGFVLPWAGRLGHPVPSFDFRLDGVTSMSADTHKYGYAPKGTSVVLYRGRDLRRHQYFTAADWPGGLYFSPTLAGSRPGALSAGAWAAMVATGEDGYLEATRRILETAAVIRDGIAGIPALEVLGDPLWVIAFGSESLDVYRVMDAMAARGWSLNGLHRPPAVHLAVTLRHTEPGIAERFVADLRAAVDEVQATPAAEGGMAPVYGLAARVPARGVVGDLLERYIDLLYEP